MSTENLIKFGYALAKAKIMAAKFDRDGYGEITVQAGEWELLFSTPCEFNLQFISAAHYDKETAREMQDALSQVEDWDEILPAKLLDEMAGEFQAAANQEYFYDFYCGEYEAA